MVKYRYTGSDERVFPTLGLTLQPNQEFEAPEGFKSTDVSPVAGDTATFKKITKSALSDTTEGE